ncbi:conserved hypothetical protein [Frigoribacterium sp. 9N]|nr:conserved hypothetical protein [Frigoribacterium sp. 9N]
MVESENFGDWYRDPWGWPEIRPAAIEQLDLDDVHVGAAPGGPRWLIEPSFHLFEIPKSFFGLRPAVLLDPTSRLVFSAAVGAFAGKLEQEVPRWSYGWRYRDGVAARSSDEWTKYQGSLERVRFAPFSGETDITSFFGSVTVSRLLEELTRLGLSSVPLGIVTKVLTQHDGMALRSGIPQRSTASSLLAQVSLKAVDDVIRVALDEGRISTARRWMDDISFEGDYAQVYRLLQEVQAAARNAGFEVNASKTFIAVGSDRAANIDREHQRLIPVEIHEVEIDDEDYPDASYMIISSDDLLDAEQAALENLAGTSRPELGLVLRSLRKAGKFNNAEAWMQNTRYLPHAADHLSRFLREASTTGGISTAELNGWFVREHTSGWAHVDWVAAQHATAISAETLSPEAMGLLRGWLSSTTNVQKLAVAVQRLGAAEPQPTRMALLRRIDSCHDPLLVRLMVFGLLATGEGERTARRNLDRFPHLRIVTKYFEQRGWVVPKAVGDFVGSDSD